MRTFSGLEKKSDLGSAPNLRSKSSKLGPSEILSIAKEAHQNLKIDF